MQHFLDENGQFEFPEHLFPDPGTRALPLASQRREQILSHIPITSQLDGIETKNDQIVNSNLRAWARDVLEFDDVWSPMPVDIINRAIKTLKLLAEKQDGAAAYALGNWGCTAQCGAGLVSSSERRLYLREALKHGINRAWYRVGMNSDARGDIEQALSRFQRGADRQDSACLFTMALAYMQGQFGLQRNVERGFNLAELAVVGADADFPRAPYLLGKILLGEGGKSANGLGIDGIDEYVTLDKHRGLELIERSALLGFAPALMRMADAYLGSERGFDCAVAVRYLSLAACQDIYRRFKNIQPILSGKPESQIVKWLLCGYEGIMIKSEDWAFKFAQVGALDQNGSALFALAYFSEVGIATKQDILRAKELYKMSAERGCAPASARLAQLETGKPELRRTLTRQDHDAKMEKHSNKLVQGLVDASEAINDESTLSPVEDTPSSLPFSRGSKSPPQSLSSSPIPQNKLPYPRGHSPSHSISVSPHRVPMLAQLSSHRSIRSVSALPYPVDEPTSATSTTNLSLRSIRSSTTSLPYPDSPEADWKRDSSSPQSHPPSSFHSASSSASGLVIPRKPIQLGETPQLSPERSSQSNSPAQQPAFQTAAESSSRPIAYPVSPIASQPGNQSTEHSADYATTYRGEDTLENSDAKPAAPYGSSHIAQHQSFSDSDSFKLPSIPHSSSVSSVPLGYYPAMETLPDQFQRVSPVHSRSSSTLPTHEANNHGSLASTSPKITSQFRSVTQPPQQTLSNLDISQSSSNASRNTLASSIPSLQPAASLTTASIKSRSRSTSPRLRRLSAQFTGSMNSMFSQSSSQPSGGQSTKSRSRSVSPLRKLFGDSPQKRAMASQTDRRSFTEAALAELKTAPKVPVQPIKTQRVPGVAYTFEEMGVQTVSTDKSDKCLLM